MARVVDENDCIDDDLLGYHEIPIGTEVHLLRFDAGDNSWLCRTALGDTAWVHEACLTEAVEVTPREVAEAIASIKRAMTNERDA